MNPPQDDSACFIQQCNQVITGRNLAYGRALEIVQNEEIYLEVADLDIIKRKRVKRQLILTNTTDFTGNLYTLADLVIEAARPVRNQICPQLTDAIFRTNPFENLSDNVTAFCDAYQFGTTTTCTGLCACGSKCSFSCNSISACSGCTGTSCPLTGACSCSTSDLFITVPIINNFNVEG